MAEKNGKSLEDSLKELREKVKKGVIIEDEDIDSDEMIQQTRQKFRRLRQRV